MVYTCPFIIRYRKVPSGTSTAYMYCNYPTTSFSSFQFAKFGFEVVKLPGPGQGFRLGLGKVSFNTSNDMILPIKVHTNTTTIDTSFDTKPLLALTLWH